MNLQHEHMYRQLYARVDELLGDGKWHSYEQTILELGKLIPPGVAIRQCERDRAQSGPARRVQALDADRQIRIGRRAIVRVLFKNRRFQADPPGAPQRRIRLRESVRNRTGGCPFDARGHNDARMQGPRGALYYVCNLCGRVQRASQHATARRTG